MGVAGRRSHDSPGDSLSPGRRRLPVGHTQFRRFASMDRSVLFSTHRLAVHASDGLGNRAFTAGLLQTRSGL